MMTKEQAMNAEFAAAKKAFNESANFNEYVETLESQGFDSETSQGYWNELEYQFIK